IGAGPAALDIVEPELVERQRDSLLVGHAEIDALSLGAVPQRAVEEVDALVVHSPQFRGKSRSSAPTAGLRQPRQPPRNTIGSLPCHLSYPSFPPSCRSSSLP